MAIKFLSTVQVDTDVLYADASSNRVGIGTTTPSTDLEISSTGVNGIDISQSASNASQSGRLFFTTNTASEGFALFNANGTFQINSGGIPNDTSGTNRISIIGSSGNVGIGTTSPQEKMHVSGSSNIRLEVEATDSTVAALKLTNTAGSYASFVNASGSLSTYDYNAASTRTTLLANGNFGLGTTSPSARLEVQGTNSNTQAALKVTDSGDSFFEVVPDNNTTFKIGDLDAVGDEAMIVGTFSDITFSKGGTTTMILDSNNRVGIGTTTPSEKLEVNGSVKATASTDAYKGYIKQTITSSANEKVDNADYNLVPYNTLTTVNSDQSYNRMVAAYDGRIKKVYIRNTSGTPTADTVNFKKQINNTTAATVYSATVANAASAGMSAVYNFADSDFTFNEGDTFGILYQTTNSGGVARAMAGVAINVIVEYNIT